MLCTDLHMVTDRMTFRVFLTNTFQAFSLIRATSSQDAKPILNSKG